MKVLFTPGKFPATLVALVVIVSMITIVGCKKKPPEVATPSDPPEVDTSSTSSSDTETIRDTNPMAQVQEEDTAAAQSMSAAQWNQRGVLKTIYFDFDKYTIRPDQRATLQDDARWLNGELSSMDVLIEGHCDERGTNEYNMALGDRRANATRDYLVSLGVLPSRIRIISYGEERPSDSGHNETAWARNRRSSFVVEGG